MRARVVTSALGALVLCCVPATAARAGIPECGDLRLEDALSCELRGDVQCSASCDELGVYKKACATRLHTVCRRECTLSADASCTDSCTEQCSRDCDRGVNVICTHNCFGECAGACDAHCAGIGDEATCLASCEATCDGECDIKCRPLVDGSCYEHCIECCGGTCQAHANLDCQTTCQEESFEQCEYDLRIDCDGACTGDGAIFCDGEYVLGGRQIPACAQALLSQGIAELDLQARGSFDLGVDGGALSGVGSSSGRGSCAVAPDTRGGRALAAGALLTCAALAWRRRRAVP